MAQVSKWGGKFCAILLMHIFTSSCTFDGDQGTKQKVSECISSNFKRGYENEREIASYCFRTRGVDMTRDVRVIATPVVTDRYLGWYIENKSATKVARIFLFTVSTKSGSLVGTGSIDFELRPNTVEDVKFLDIGKIKPNGLEFADLEVELTTVYGYRFPDLR